jgi:hypothetical protein
MLGGLDLSQRGVETPRLKVYICKLGGLHLSQRGLGQDSKSWKFQKVGLKTSRYLNLFLDCS